MKPIQNLFPRSAKYDDKWVKDNSMGENVLFNLESLLQVMPLKPGMRVLDLACGKAISAIFLAKEYEVEVWAIDEAISATENYKRICDSECQNKVFPLQIDARHLPFPESFFDAIVVIDSYTYFGTDDKYLPYLAKFLKPDGRVGIVDVGFTHEIETFAQVPPFLKADYSRYWYFIHTADWWKKMWERTGLVDITCAELLPGEQASAIKAQYIADYQDKPKEPFARALREDKENIITFFRLVGTRKPTEAYLQDYKKEARKGKK
ncbi:methyltransferase domain-containing protein [Rhodocytophaga rosea]|uniref:Methyltransferase domain-containing protein n=1 Tax=Rhodocytophaga rosea TaxID=2704465 RepID=A0A6C0GUR8_9BACT|nr:methyltransferase domain-containing protein [Rhodocytophaga rosea]QHT71080.1 methyltransferase domain-containing protein [Rhodocytophaga rosea]